MNSKVTLSNYRMTGTANLRIFANLPALPTGQAGGRQGRILFFTLIFTFIFLNCSYAQNENIPTYMSTINPVKAEALAQAGWKGAYLNVAGSNIIDGVEVFSQLSTCNSEEVIFLTLINHNDHDVRIEWMGGVYTKNHQWIDDPEGSKSITIKANEEVLGDCSHNKELLMRLKDYTDRADNFNRYAPSSFEVTIE